MENERGTLVDPHKGVRLGTYLAETPRYRVALWCNACQHKRSYSLSEVIAQLDGRGMKGKDVGIRELAGLVREPCPKCGARDRFETRPDFPPAKMGLGK